MKIDHTETAPAGHLRYVLRTSWQEIEIMNGLIEKAYQHTPRTRYTAKTLAQLKAMKRQLNECLRSDPVVNDIGLYAAISETDPRKTFTLPTIEAAHALIKAVDKLLPKPKDNRSIPFTPRAKQLPKEALKIARELGHDCVQPIHLLIAALRTPAQLRSLVEDAGHDAMALADAFTEKAKDIEKYSQA